MLNGTTGSAAVCCQYAPDGQGAGIKAAFPSLTGGLAGGSLSAGFPQQGGILEAIGAAIDKAIHGGDSGTLLQFPSVGQSQIPRGANEINFPMVNPFKPVVATRSPVTGLNAFPKHLRVVPQADDGSEPDDEQSSLSGLGSLDGLGYTWADFGAALKPPSLDFASGPSKLQTIVGAIQTTLPATIQALRAQPSNIYPYSPYTSNAGGAYPGYTEYPQQQGGAATDVGQRVGGAVGGVGDTLGSIVRDHPYLVLAGVAGAVLLFMSPPRRR